MSLYFNFSNFPTHFHEQHQFKNNPCLFFKKWANPSLFFIYFCLFQTHITNFTTNRYVKKCPSSIWCEDLNSWPLEHESPPITTRPGLSLYCCVNCYRAKATNTPFSYTDVFKQHFCAKLDHSVIKM